MANKVVSGTKDWDKVLSGVSLIVDAVKSTYGPNGNNVVIYREGDVPHITKDGVTVANSINVSDPLVDIGVSLIKDVATKTLRSVGDGTSTSCLNAGYLIAEGFKAIAEQQLNPFLLRDYLFRYANIAVDKLKATSTSIDVNNFDTLFFLAKNSANGDEDIARKVVELYRQIGSDGVVVVKDSPNFGISTSVVDGVRFNRGYMSPMYCDNGLSCVQLENPFVLIAKRKIRETKEIVDFLDCAIKSDRPVLILAPDVDPTVHNMVLTNKMRGALKGACIVGAPHLNEVQQEFLHDMVVLTGAIESNYKDLLIGTCENVEVSRDYTELNGFLRDGGVYSNHLKFLQDLAAGEEDVHLKKRFSDRLAIFNGKLGYINVGTYSESSTLELKDKIDDVIHSVKAALDDGIVFGGGYHVGMVANDIANEFGSLNGICKEEVAAIKLIVGVLRQPSEILGIKKKNEFLIDSTKVVYTAIYNALDVACLLLTSNYIIVDE